MRQQGRPIGEYTPGTTVFAKLKGYPWWPARIESDQTVPAKILKQKSKSKGTLYTVFFYGSRDYGFFGPDAIRPFDPVNVEVDLKAKKFKTKDLELAIRQALNPALLAEIEEEEEEEEEENDEDEDEDEDEKTKEAAKEEDKKGKKKKTNEAKTKPTTKSVKQPVKRKSRKGADIMEVSKSEQVQDRKKRRKSMSIEKEEEGVGDEGISVNKGENKKSPEYKKIYHLRHKLQRLVYNKKEGEIPKEDYPKISSVVKEIEEAPMTYNFLKDTKIGKVVKAAMAYPFEDDTGIKDRCQQLMRNWKHSFIELQPHKAEKTEDGDTIMQEA